MKLVSNILVAAFAAALSLCCFCIAGCDSGAKAPAASLEVIGNDEVNTIVVKITNNTDKCLVFSNEESLVADFMDASGKVVETHVVSPNDPIYAPAGEETYGVVYFFYESMDPFASVKVTIDESKLDSEDIAGMEQSAVSITDEKHAAQGNSLTYEYKARYVGENDQVNGFRVLAYALDADGKLLVGEQLSNEFVSDEGTTASGSYDELDGIVDGNVLVYPTIV